MYHKQKAEQFKQRQAKVVHVIKEEKIENATNQMIDLRLTEPEVTQESEKQSSNRDKLSKVEFLTESDKEKAESEHEDKDSRNDDYYSTKEVIKSEHNDIVEEVNGMLI